jgi:nucleoid-associated protein EbfC
MFKNLTNVAALLKNLPQMGAQVQAMQTKLAEARVYGSGGNGVVNVEMSGAGIVLNVCINSGYVASEHHASIEQWTKDAMNEASRAAKLLHIQSLRELTGGTELFPGFSDMLKNFAG